MARFSKPILLFAISGIASVVATLLLMTWSARSTTDVEGLANGRSGALSDDSTGEPASTDSAASAEEATALAQLFAEDPVAALRSAAALRAADARRHAVLEVGKRWASTHPEAALSMASTLPSILRVDYLAIVSREWANLDPDGFLRFAERATDREALMGGLELLIPSEPVRVFEIVGGLGQGEGPWTLMYVAAATAMAEQDVTLALRTLESAPRGPVSDYLQRLVLSAHGRKDPDAALAWLGSLDSPSTAVRAGIYEGIAQADFARGYGLLMGIPVDSDAGVASSYGLADGAVQDAESAARVAGILLDIGTDRATELLEGVTTNWAWRDPGSLVDWMIDNATAIEPQLVRSIGLNIATNDLESALGLAKRLPPAIGNLWVPQIAGAYARQDPRAALDWVARYQGQPYYDEAHVQAVLRAAESDPELVASMLPGLPVALRASAIPDIATAWVQRDPRAAAEWVAGLEDAAAERATGEVIRGWMRRDLEAATQWALSLPRGRMRDGALASLIGGSYGVNLDVRRIFNEIESADLRRQAAMSAAFNRSSTDPEVTRDFLESLLDDAELGEWAREQLDRIAAGN